MGVEFSLVLLLLGALALAWALAAKVLRDARREQDRLAAQKLAEALQRHEHRAAEQARQLAIEAIVASAQVMAKPESAMVKCSNGHRYMLKDFVIETSYVETDYEQHGETVYTERGSYYKSWEVPYVYSNVHSRFGCPLCKSTLAEFEDPKLSGVRRCGRCGWWSQHPRACPVCQLDGVVPQGFAEPAIPLNEEVPLNPHAEVLPIQFRKRSPDP